MTKRPFSESARVKCRGHSTFLQKVIVDFAADASYAEATKKLKFHYGIDVAESSIQSITNKHSTLIHKNLQTIQKKICSSPSKSVIIGEIDGGMVPIVSFKEGSKGDRRKTRQTSWSECRLSISYQQGSVESKYGAVIEAAARAGENLEYVIGLSGGTKDSKKHIVGDGAPWIAEQVELKFGGSANFLLDYFHMSEYLSSASQCQKLKDPRSWFHKQQNRMKAGQITEVIQELEDHVLDPNNPPDHKCAICTCYNYLIKRTKQLNYKEAIESNLPIGSGKIESGHRSVIQKRLKLPGAWWLKQNAQNMASLRVLRANGGFEQYWSKAQPSELSTN